MRFAFAILALSICTQAAWANRIQQVKSYLERSVYACPERIWDGLDWKKARITLLSPSTASGIVLQNGESKAVDPKIAKKFQSHYDFVEGGVIVNVDMLESAKDSFAIAVHEGFHSFGQKNLPYTTEGREDGYPAKAEPRLAREELTRALIGFFRGEVGSLERAAGWNKRHAESKENLSADVIEGSAEYVEKMALAIAELGCGAPEINLVNHAVDTLADQGAAFDKGYEHYRIGALAFLMARPKFNYVLKRLDGKALPLDVIFENVEAEENLVADTLLEHAVEMTVSMSNRQAEATILPVREAIAEKKTLVFVPFEKLDGSFVHAGSYSADGESYYQSIELVTQGKQLRGHGKQVTACGDEHGFLMVTEVQGAAANGEYQGAPVICL